MTEGLAGLPGSRSFTNGQSAGCCTALSIQAWGDDSGHTQIRPSSTCHPPRQASRRGHKSSTDSWIRHCLCGETPSFSWQAAHLGRVGCHAGALARAGGLLCLGAVVGCLGDGSCLAGPRKAPAMVRALQGPIRGLYPALRQRRQPAGVLHPAQVLCPAKQITAATSAVQLPVHEAQQLYHGANVAVSAEHCTVVRL